MEQKMFLEEKINTLIDEQKKLTDMVRLFLPKLETEKGVIHFLEITKNTFNKYMKDGVFVEGYHYYIQDRKKVFVPDAIIELKNSGVKGKRKVDTKQDKVNSIKAQLGMISMCRSAV